MFESVTFTIQGVSNISFSKAITSLKNTGEGHDAFEVRTFRERVHTDKSGLAVMPSQAMKKCLVECAKYLQETVKGKGKSTWTKHLEAGLLELDVFPIYDAQGKRRTPEELPFERLHLPSDGMAGGTRRVYKQFCYFEPDWTCSGKFYIFDPMLQDNPAKIKEYLEFAGKFIGLCRWRPRKGGQNGRFELTKFEPQEATNAA